jgi:hypothetical protein
MMAEAMTGESDWPHTGVPSIVAAQADVTGAPAEA